LAVIDTGIDIDHADLQGKIWTNRAEIPGNGIDDDGNGYIDDIHGWNYLGHPNGENISHENLEYTRLVKQYRSMFDTIASTDQLPAHQLNIYRQYVAAEKEYEKEKQKFESRRKSITDFENRMLLVESILREHLLADELSIPAVQKIKTKNKRIKAAKSIYLGAHKNGYTEKVIAQMKKGVDEYLNYKLNLDYSPRTLLNDDITNLSDINYGNNDVVGPDAFHGTFVAGIIAANRNNHLGINGIADSIQIMVLRAIPDGDEYDKDVALAIMYAVDNGAKIINMSFGKAFSPHKHLVDKAVKHAEANGVLLIHAAGNDSNNIDEIPNYPNNTTDTGIATNWLNVGASTYKKGKQLPATFSNYGQHNVDLFAPGANLISLTTRNKYIESNGTSFAAPVVSGVAALVWSHYPHLTATQLREILLKSVSPLRNQKVYLPNSENQKKKTTTQFGKLSKSGGIINAYEALRMAATVN
jgi:subtilisin family serine protease